ncbi:Xylogalacturonan beta-1,3-xylosyltransferase [Apostasia shenzhenica]|uniref:Xylogalacturonan beta-1,3-xylosyltransferase n=1 Tax=Apostasia shenzhenica TaxID=1088818 RepID=A0A2I0BFQ2_9ASPA|nr:Xylogalacturonan beta-1,3-xylosyltransferase [Apostasia shenzhenica]
MSERKMQFSLFETRRFLFYLVSLSIFLLFFSCFALLRSSSSSSLIPESVLMLMVVNNTSVLSNRGFSSKSIPNLFSPMAPATFLKSKENDKVRRGCDSAQAILKVYMYDLPTEFHFGLLGWKGKKNQIWPNTSDLNHLPSYPGGLNLQHSVEYWLTLDLLASDYPNASRPCTAIRVHDSNLADVIFVPFFSSVSYNRHSKVHGKEKISKDKMLQDKLVKFLRDQKEWKKSAGRDHLIMAHHPNSLLDARTQLGYAMFLLADFGRYPVEIANIKKDIIAPYKHVVSSIKKYSATFEARRILAYFQGAIIRKDVILCIFQDGMIRQELYRLLKDEKDVHFAYGAPSGNGISRTGEGMALSKFCLTIAGDTPSSNRLFDAIVSLCVPVIISDEIELPFEDVLDYSEFAVFVQASDAINEGFLVNLLRGINRDKWMKMWTRLKEVAHHFEYQYPSKEGDAVGMIWKAVARKLSHVRLRIHKENRFHRYQIRQ